MMSLSIEMFQYCHIQIWKTWPNPTEYWPIIGRLIVCSLYIYVSENITCFYF